MLKSYLGNKNTKMIEVPSSTIKNVYKEWESFSEISGTVKSFVHLGSEDERKIDTYKRRPVSSRSLQHVSPKPLVIEHNKQRSSSTTPTLATVTGITTINYRPSQSSQAWPVIIQSSTKSKLNQHKLENIEPVQRFVHLGTPAKRKRKVFERSIVNYPTGRQKLKVHQIVPKDDTASSMNREGFVKYGYKIQLVV